MLSRRYNLNFIRRFPRPHNVTDIRHTVSHIFFVVFQNVSFYFQICIPNIVRSEQDTLPLLSLLLATFHETDADSHFWPEFSIVKSSNVLLIKSRISLTSSTFVRSPQISGPNSLSSDSLSVLNSLFKSFLSSLHTAARSLDIFQNKHGYRTIWENHINLPVWI